MTGTGIAFPWTKTAQRLAIGAVAAAVLGSSAGAALKPQPPDRRPPVAPQQIILPEPELTAMEALGGGWPASAPG